MQEHAENSFTPPYAVLFRTHFWDEFAQRQLDRLLSRVGQGHVYVLVDETAGKVHGIRHDRVVRLTESDVLAMGLPRAGTGSLFWFAGDYPLYYFFERCPGYAYYLQIEYDVTLNRDVDGLVRAVAADHADFIGLTKGEPVDEWAWLETCRDAYPAEQIRYKLICLSLFSNRALRRLLARRLDMAADFARGELASWPFCEGFIATEMAQPGFVSIELSRYGDTSQYDSWPPFVESDLHATGGAFIHPVLDRPRYVASLLKYRVGIEGYLNVNSLLHRKLRRLPARDYAGTLALSFVQKALRTLRSRLRTG